MKPVLKTIYGRIRETLPDSAQGYLSRMAFLLADKPNVRADQLDPDRKFPNKEKGGLIISADFEMAWAWRYTKTGSDHIQKGRLERQNMPDILNVLETYNIPITFATVGHLFLEECRPGDHDWMTRIPHFDDHWRFVKGDWFDHDPYSNYKDAPEWYAPDLVRMILASGVAHEIGSHTFTHIDFSDKNCPPTVADDEITACREVASSYGIELTSMVFPGGTWGNIRSLKQNNFVIYRKSCDFELSYPFRDDDGLLVSSSSGPLEHNLRYGWSSEYFLYRLRKYVRKAMETNTIAHFWFHPSLDPYFLKKILPPFFEFAAKQREKGNLWIGPMNRIAEYINEKKLYAQ